MSLQNLKYAYPLEYHNQLYETLPYKQVYIDNTWLVIPKILVGLITDYLNFKRTHGTRVEKELYLQENFDEGKLIKRLFTQRPLTFTGSADSFTLRDTRRGIGHWEIIGTDQEQEPLVLRDYLSYDEISLAAFVSLSCFTPFLNNGSRSNSGRVDNLRQPNGVYIGQVGARFQKHKRMEWRFMMIDPEQNTWENGYGPQNNSVPGQYLKIWAKFFGVDYFPTYEDAMQDQQKWFGREVGEAAQAHLNVPVYKRRIGINAEVFLKEANNRAKNIGKHAFCHAVGLGLGVCAVDRKLQQRLTVEVYLDILNTPDNKGKFAYTHIKDLYFAWFNEVEDSSAWPNQLHGIRIHFGKREPAEPIEDPNGLLVCNWAWDANSYVGNEYWDGFLSTSGDPAAACCSFIAYLGNPDINPVKEVHIW
jgi:hypothetical protein